MTCGTVLDTPGNWQPKEVVDPTNYLRLTPSLVPKSTKKLGGVWKPRLAYMYSRSQTLSKTPSVYTVLTPEGLGMRLTLELLASTSLNHFNFLWLSTSYTQSEPHICPKTQNFQRVRLMSLAHLSAEPFLVCGSCTPAMLTSMSPAPGAGSVLQQWWPSVAWPAVLGNRPTSTTRSMRDENQHHWLIPKLPTLLTSVTQTTSNGKWNIIWPEAG